MRPDEILFSSPAIDILQQINETRQVKKRHDNVIHCYALFIYTNISISLIFIAERHLTFNFRNEP